MTRNAESNPSETRSLLLAIAAICILVLGVLIGTWALAPVCFGKIGGPGVFGDMFGFANALFSGLALGGIIVAILLQRTELKLQREELKDTRAELAGQKEQLRLQVELGNSQKYESAFFELLGRLDDILWSIESREDTADASGYKRGQDALAYYLSGLGNWTEDWDLNQEYDDRRHRLRVAYQESLGPRRHQIGPYLNHFGLLLRFVDSEYEIAGIPYHQVLLNQLSSVERAIVYYDLLLNEGSGLPKDLLDRWGFLEHVRADDLLEEGDRELLILSPE